MSKKNTNVLTAEMALAILLVRDGADVYSQFLGNTLRTVEKLFPQFVSIGAAQMREPDPRKRQPYFGAIATPAGVERAEWVGTWGPWLDDAP